jgi:hypothetical protein
MSINVYSHLMLPDPRAAISAIRDSLGGLKEFPSQTTGSLMVWDKTTDDK